MWGWSVIRTQGKSTLISRISAARPKIADYPFTTLEPNLGVVTVGEEPEQQSFVVADVPGLIEGAHLGAGLGTQFLRHIERTRVLAHLVDVSDSSGRPDPVEDFRVINNELANFTDGSAHPLAEKPMIVVATKIDAANPAKLKKLAAHAKRRKLEFHAISAVTGEGIDELKWALAKRVRPSEGRKAARRLAQARGAHLFRRFSVACKSFFGQSSNFFSRECERFCEFVCLQPLVVWNTECSSVAKQNVVQVNDRHDEQANILYVESIETAKGELGSLSARTLYI